MGTNSAEGPRFLYIFIDESGNLDFASAISRWYLLGALVRFRPFDVENELNDIRYDIVEAGYDAVDVFHASNNAAPVRRRVFDHVEKHNSKLAFHSLAVDKHTVTAA